jgi:hypothetical protein
VKRLVRVFFLSVVLAATTLTPFQSTSFGQDFVDLNFEDATVSPTEPGQLGSFVDPTIAFPGWQVSNAVCFYNDVSLGSQAVCLMGPDFSNFFGLSPLEGSYSVLMMTFSNSVGSRPILSQTGLIPADAKSITFLAGTGALTGTRATNALVTIGGVNIPIVPLPDGLFAGDVSAFAGSVEGLTFSTTIVSRDVTELYFDDVTFSTMAIPEPSSFWLVCAAGVLLGWRFVGSLPSVARARER